jgi:hypothetical protein
MIKVTESNIHWNYFLALERDVERISRFVEFTSGNFKTFSIELARILFSAASEVDVISKSLCESLQPGSNPKNINDYRSIVTSNLPEFAKEKVFVPRYGLTLDPWSAWRKHRSPDNPIWWRAYNNVKHQRDQHFDQANLQHTLNAMAGLLVTVFYFQHSTMKQTWPLTGRPLGNKDVTAKLAPQSELLRLSDGHYFDSIVV